MAPNPKGFEKENDENRLFSLEALCPEVDETFEKWRDKPWPRPGLGLWIDENVEARSMRTPMTLIPPASSMILRLMRSLVATRLKCNWKLEFKETIGSMSIRIQDYEYRES